MERLAPIDGGRLGIYRRKLAGGDGDMTTWAVTQTTRFREGRRSRVAGISDWLSYYGENGIDEWMILYFGASVRTTIRKIYARSSPITYIRNVKTPVFEYVGASDIECPAPQTQEFRPTRCNDRVLTDVLCDLSRRGPRPARSRPHRGCRGAHARLVQAVA